MRAADNPSAIAASSGAARGDIVNDVDGDDLELLMVRFWRSLPAHLQEVPMDVHNIGELAYKELCFDAWRQTGLQMIQRNNMILKELVVAKAHDIWRSYDARGVRMSEEVYAELVHAIAQASREAYSLVNL